MVCELKAPWPPTPSSGVTVAAVSGAHQLTACPKGRPWVCSDWILAMFAVHRTRRAKVVGGGSAAVLSSWPLRFCSSFCRQPCPQLNSHTCMCAPLGLLLAAPLIVCPRDCLWCVGPAPAGLICIVLLGACAGALRRSCARIRPMQAWGIAGVRHSFFILGGVWWLTSWCVFVCV